MLPQSKLRDRAGGQYGSASEYVRELIRRDQDRALLHGLLLDGASSPIAGSAEPPASTAGAPVWASTPTKC